MVAVAAFIAHIQATVFSWAYFRIPITKGKPHTNPSGAKAATTSATLYPVVRELVDRLLATGQIEPADGRVKFPPDSEYVVEWYSAFELNDVDKTRITLWESTTYKNFGSFMMVDEIRELRKLKALPDDEGKVVLELRKLEVQAMKGAAQVRPGQPQPKEGEPQGNRPEER